MLLPLVVLLSIIFPIFIMHGFRKAIAFLVVYEDEDERSIEKGQTIAYPNYSF